MSRFRLGTGVAALLACFGGFAPQAAGQLFKNSVVSTDFDFIRADDPSAFVKLTPKGRHVREMPDKRPGTGDLLKTAFVFEASFNDGTVVELNLSLDFATDEAALKEAERYTGPLGKLPTALRKGLNRVVVHKGGENLTASADVGTFKIYSDNAAKRISTHDLEETVFHESVHAAWDKTHAGSEGWIRAQIADGGFLTDYAKRLPTREDLAESALFAYTLTHHPERFPEDTAKKIRAAMPNRIAYVAGLIPKGKPIFYTVPPPSKVATSGKAEPPNRTPDPGAEKPNGATASDNVACNIRLRGTFADVLSNTLRNMGQEESKVRKWLDAADRQKGTSEELFQAAVREFRLAPDELKRKLVTHLHVNCKHGAFDDEPAKRLIAAWKAPAPGK